MLLVPSTPGVRSGQPRVGFSLQPFPSVHAPAANSKDGARGLTGTDGSAVGAKLYFPQDLFSLS